MSLNAFDQYAQLAAVFDLYRIVELEYRYVPRMTVPEAIGITTPGVFHTCVDFDDSTPLTTVAGILDYPSCKLWAPGQPNNNLIQRFKPRISMAVWAGAFAGYNAAPGTQWLDSVNAGIAYYGVKTAWTVTSSVMYMDLYVTARMQFRQVR